MAKLQPGEVFAGYLIERELGAGGMGEVYLVRHPRLPRRDALKLLGAGLSDDARFRARFEREADVVSGLSHPHIVKVHDRGEEDGRLWIAFEYIDGHDLGELARRGSIPVADVVRMIGEVAGALDDAGRRGLIHRDVKPANILVDPAGRALLTDFGIARAAEDTTSHLTMTGTAIGTVSFASPEQLRDLPVDARSDQYSLACTAFALLTGAPPYAGGSPTATIFSHVQDPIPSASARNPSLPAAVDQVFARALAKNPADRFPDSGSFAAALNAAVRDESGAAATLVRSAVDIPGAYGVGQPYRPDLAQTQLPPPAYSPSAENRGRRRARLLLVVAVVIAVLVVAAGAAAFFVTRPATSAGPTPTGVLAASAFGYCAARHGSLACTSGTGNESLTVVEGLSGVSDVATDGGNTCAIASGDLYCWGDNTNGQLGIEAASGSSSTTPQRVQGIAKVTDVAVGDHVACAISEGNVYCWGKLGTSDSGRGKVTRPEKVAKITGATVVTTSEGTMCAVADRSAWCWGDNTGGQAGTGNTDSIPIETPFKLQNLGTSVTAIVTSQQLTCAVADGQPACWGAANWLRLSTSGSNGSVENVYGMSGITGLASANVRDIRTNPMVTSPLVCGLAGGSVMCRGANAMGQLGQGNTQSTFDTVKVAGVTAASKVAVGQFFGCAMTGSDEQIMCWGEQVPGRPYGILEARAVAWPS